MNYVTHTRIAFARLSVEPTATAQHISIYVALFQQWNNAHFPASLMLMRDELMAAAHIGNRSTYVKCLRDLDTWGFITYLPSQSPHKASRAFMHEQEGLNQPESARLTMHKSVHSSVHSRGQVVSQAVDQPVSTIIKTSENEANEVNTENFSNTATADARKKTVSSCEDELLSEESIPSNRCNADKEKVASKRKIRSHTTQERKVKRPEVPFAESEFADLSAFIAAFTGTDFELANLRYYHEKVANWRKDGEPPRRRDWKATAKTFMLNDVERNALVLAPGSQRSTSGTPPHCTGPSDQTAEYVSQRYS
ncbi:MAG: hypothetical protein ACRYFV_20410 [Janthinobacterium lividum]